jgi:hypothetical protein
VQSWRYRLGTTNLAEGCFRNLRAFSGRFSGFLSPDHCDRALGIYLLSEEIKRFSTRPVDSAAGSGP